MDSNSFTDLFVTSKPFLALLLCPCSGKCARELSPLIQYGPCQDLGNYLTGSVTPPKLLGPENIKPGQKRPRIGGGTDHALQSMEDLLAHQSHDVFLSFEN